MFKPTVRKIRVVTYIVCILLTCTTELVKQETYVDDINWKDIIWRDIGLMDMAWDDVCLKAMDRAEDDWKEWTAHCAGHWKDLTV